MKWRWNGGDELAKDRHQAKYIPFRCGDEMAQKIQHIAAVENLPVSIVLRDLVRAGLEQKGYMEGESLEAKIANAVQTALKPSVERLAAITAKGTQISAASFFMGVYAAGQGMSPRAIEDLDAVVAQSRQLGIRYLKLDRSSDFDDFLKQGAKKMRDGDD